MPVKPCVVNQVTAAQLEKEMTPDKRAKLWAYAKKLGANTGVDHESVIANIADEQNWPRRLVAQALDGPKSIRQASENVRAKQKMSQQFLAENRRYLEQFDRTGSQKILNGVNDVATTNLLRYHGPVPPVTHAIDIAATNPVEFAAGWLRGWQSISDAARDRIMTDMKDPLLHPDYPTALKAGLPIEDEVAEGFKAASWAGNSMDASLKPMRLALWEREWYGVPKEERTPEFAKHLASIYAHATGALVKGEPIEVMSRPVRKFLLARQLTPSKLGIIGDNVKALQTFERMFESSKLVNKILPERFRNTVRPATTAEKNAARIVVLRAARYFGPVLTGLAVNQALLKATGSDQEINVMHPSRSDFGAFKAFGKTFRMRGTLEIIALIAKLAALGAYQKKKFGAPSAEEAAMKYGEYKMAPGLGIGYELATGKDLFGRPAPWSSDPGNRVFPRKNWIEAVGEHTPIFVGHGIMQFHEALRDQGVDTRLSRNVIKALGTKEGLKAAIEGVEASIPEFFGVNVQEDRYIGRGGTPQSLGGKG